MPVLIISEDLGHREALASISSGCGFQVVGCGTLCVAQYLLSRQRFTAILYEVPEHEDFRVAVRQLAHSESETPVVLVSHIDNWESYLVAVAAGAFDYINFPPRPGELERILRLALSEGAVPNMAMAQQSLTELVMLWRGL